LSHYTVLLDANVLYPAPLRDALMQLAVTDLYKAKRSRRCCVSSRSVIVQHLSGRAI
jgi:hypothetical protein